MLMNVIRWCALNLLTINVWNGNGFNISLHRNQNINNKHNLMKTTKIDRSFIPIIIVVISVLIAIVIFWLHFSSVGMSWAGVN